MKASSISAIQGTICKLTSLKDKLQIKRKTKALTNNKLTWWFVIHGQESVLGVLDPEWEKVHAQTGWSLQHCYMSCANIRDVQNDVQAQFTTSSLTPSPPTPDDSEAVASAASVNLVPEAASYYSSHELQHVPDTSPRISATQTSAPPEPNLNSATASF